MVGWIIAGALAALFIWVVIWALRWKDPSWTDERQKGAKFGWSKRGSGSGGMGA